MKISRLLKLVIFLSAAGLSGQSLSARAEDCSKTLVQSSANYALDEVTQLSIAWNLSEEEYNSASKNAEASAIIYGVPLGGSYGEFKQNVRKKAESYKLQNFEKRSIAYATRALSPEAVKAYIACRASDGGLVLVVTDIGKSSYEVQMAYHPKPGQKVGKWAVSDSSNIAPENLKAVKKLIADSGKDSVEFQFNVRPKKKNDEAVLTVSATGISATVTLPPIASPALPTITISERAMNGAPLTALIDCKVTGGVGTLLCGQEYSAQYNNKTNGWTVTGYNNGVHGIGTWIYANAPAKPGNISLWGALFTFSDDGYLYYEKKRTGKIYPANSP